MTTFMKMSKTNGENLPPHAAHLVTIHLIPDGWHVSWSEDTFKFLIENLGPDNLMAKLLFVIKDKFMRPNN